MAATVDLLEVKGFTDGDQVPHATVDVLDVRGRAVGAASAPATVDILGMRAAQPTPAQLRVVRHGGAWVLATRLLRLNSEWVAVDGS